MMDNGIILSLMAMVNRKSKKVWYMRASSLMGKKQVKE